MDLKFDNYIRLNDLDESLLCCDNVLSISRNLAFGERQIVVHHACANESVIFKYDNIDTLMSDLENIKNKILSSKL